MARIEISWLPAVGAARYEVREQGSGDTPIERYRSGKPLGPRVGNNKFRLEGVVLRTYHLSIRSYNRAGVGSPEPAEITVTPTIDGGPGLRLPTDMDLVSYWSMDEQYDQGGNEMNPSIFNGLREDPPDTSNWPNRVADPAGGPTELAEHRRRMIYDQGPHENHLFLDTDLSTPPPHTVVPSCPSGSVRVLSEKKSRVYATVI